MLSCLATETDKATPLLIPLWSQEANKKGIKKKRQQCHSESGSMSGSAGAVSETAVCTLRISCGGFSHDAQLVTFGSPSWSPSDCHIVKEVKEGEHLSEPSGESRVKWIKG